MRFIGFVILFCATIASAQVDMSETEKLDQVRESNRKEDALREDALKPNAKPEEAKRFNLNMDTNAQLDVDHTGFGYSVINVDDNPLTGVKFSGAFSAGFYQEQKLKKRYLLTGGVELPIELDLPFRRVMPFWGAGLQFGIDSALYGDIGVDIRLTKWFKLQAGIHYPIGKEVYGLFGAALTW